MNIHSAVSQSVILGVFFLLLITTYSSYSFIITYIFSQPQHQGYAFVGPLILIINYAAYLFTLTFTPLIKNFKQMFMLASLCYAANYALQIPEVGGVVGAFLSTVGALLGGVGAAVLWVSQGGYMMNMFKKYKVGYNDQGKYFAILNSLVYANYLLGSLITTFGLGFFGNKVYFALLTLVALLALLLAAYLLQPTLHQVQEQLISDQVLQHTPQFDQLIKTACMNSVQQFPTMKHILMVLFMGGFMLGFLSSYIINILPVGYRTSITVGLFLCVEGVGAILGGVVSGICADKYNFVRVGQGCLVVVCCNLCMIYVSGVTESVVLAFVSVLGWGFADNFLEGWSVIACGKMYRGTLASYAVTKQMHTTSFILFQLLMLIWNNQINVVGTLLAIAAMALVALLMLQRYSTKYYENQMKEIAEESPE